MLWLRHECHAYLHCVFLICVSVAFLAPEANAEDPRDRLIRLHKSKKAKSAKWGLKWGRDKVEANLMYRCPVSASLGYMALHYAEKDPETFAQLVRKLTLIARELARYQNSEIRGRYFPKKLERSLADLRAELFETIETLYGNKARQALVRYLDHRFHQLASERITGRIRFDM